MTTYVILQQTVRENGGIKARWEEVARVEARSDVSAIRSHDSTYAGDHGVYVAVPVRSWRPRTVKTVQQTRLTIT